MASVAPAAMARIAAGSGDCLRGTFLRYGLLRWRRVEVEQALNCWSPAQMNSPLTRESVSPFAWAFGAETSNGVSWANRRPQKTKRIRFSGN
jgi:hypothetical protein